MLRVRGRTRNHIASAISAYLLAACVNAPPPVREFQIRHQDQSEISASLVESALASVIGESNVSLGCGGGDSDLSPPGITCVFYEFWVRYEIVDGHVLIEAGLLKRGSPRNARKLDEFVAQMLSGFAAEADGLQYVEPLVNEGGQVFR